MIEEIKEYLKNPEFEKGVFLLGKISNNKALVNNISRANNKFNFDKIKYLIIKKFAEIANKKINESNYHEFLNIEIIIPEKKLPSELLGSAQKKEDKDYNLYKNYPDNIQKLIIEKGKCSILRAKLHKECREISGNSKKTKDLRKIKLDEMDDLTKRIKEIHHLIQIYEEIKEK